MRIFCVQKIGILCLCAGLYHPHVAQAFQDAAATSTATATSPAHAATELHRIFDEDWIARLKAFPLYTAHTMALMRQGIQARMLHPKIVMQRFPA